MRGAEVLAGVTTMGLDERPRVVRGRQLFSVGAGAHFLAAALIAAYVFLILSGVPSLVFIRHGGLALSVALSGALLLHTLAYLGCWRTFGMKIAGVAFVFGLIAASLFLATAVWAYELCEAPYYCYGWLTFASPIIIGFVLLGVIFVLDGVVLLLMPRFVPTPGYSVEAAVLLIFGGSLLMCVLVAGIGIGLSVLLAALIVAGDVLAKAPRASVAVGRA